MIVIVVCVHVEDITVAGMAEACDCLSKCLLEGFQTTGGELSWYLGCMFERDKDKGVSRVAEGAQRVCCESV